MSIWRYRTGIEFTITVLQYGQSVSQRLFVSQHRLPCWSANQWVSSRLLVHLRWLFDWSVWNLRPPPVNNQCSHRGRRGETRDDVMRRNARWEFIEHWITAATGINTSVKSRQVHCYHVLTAVSEAEDGGTDRWKDRWINRVTVRTDRWKGQQMDGQAGL